MNLQVRGLSDVSMSPTVVLFESKKASSGSLPKEVLRLFKMKGLKARISRASAKGWRGGSWRVMFDDRTLVRSALQRCERGRDDRRISLWHTNVRRPKGRVRSVREYFVAGWCCLKV